MGSFNHSAAALRIFKDDLNPEDITCLLGCEPTVAQRTGEMIQYSSGRQRKVKCGNWLLVADDVSPEDLDSQVRWILSQVTSDLNLWKSLAAYDVDMFCGLFMAGSNDGFSLSPEILLMLGERGIISFGRFIGTVISRFCAPPRKILIALRWGNDLRDSFVVPTPKFSGVCRRYKFYEAPVRQ